MKKFILSVLAIIAGMIIILLGIYLLNKVYNFILSIGVVQSILNFHHILAAIIVFALTLTVYGTPYAIAMPVALVIAKGKAAPIIITVLYIALCVYFAYFFMLVSGYMPLVSGVAICAISPIYKTILLIKKMDGYV